MPEVQRLARLLDAMSLRVSQPSRARERGQRGGEATGVNCSAPGGFSWDGGVPVALCVQQAASTHVCCSRHVPACPSAEE